ncbi:MAG TPA: hypothetical protein VKA67_12370, partial [Verrucomicrobiae bacterium]|nr:hypothetical protein [Verrucomicrobiae bacterium]
LILGRAILPRPQYTALDTRSGYKTVFMKHGLPKFIQREGGLWRNSKLVNSLAQAGVPATPFSGAELEFRLATKGTRFFDEQDAVTESRLKSVGINFKEVYSANAKIVERVIGVVSDQFEKVPGYCGRNEALDCPEITRKNMALVAARKAHPYELGFLPWPELVAAVDFAIEKYNGERQEGRRLAHPLTGAPMSPHEAFELYWNHDDPPTRFDRECAMLLSHIRSAVEVKPPNLRRRNFPCGYVEIRGNIYCNAETGRRIGQKLIAHFDPAMPDTCTFTDERLRNPFTVPRLKPVNGWQMDDQTRESLAQARETIAAVKADFRAMQVKFEPLFRKNIVSRPTAHLNAHIETESRAVRQRQHQEET